MDGYQIAVAVVTFIAGLTLGLTGCALWYFRQMWKATFRG